MAEPTQEGQATGEGQSGTEAPGQNGETGGGGGLPVPPMLLILLVGVWVLWLLSMRSNKKKAKDRKEQLEAVKKGARIITHGGLHGDVVALDEKTMTIKPDKNSNLTMTFERAALWKFPGADDEGENK